MERSAHGPQGPKKEGRTMKKMKEIIMVVTGVGIIVGIMAGTWRHEWGREAVRAEEQMKAEYRLDCAEGAQR